MRTSMRGGWSWTAMAMTLLVAGTALAGTALGARGEAGAASGKELPDLVAAQAPLLVPGEWVEVEAGVLQRLHLDGSVETYATGLEGKEFHARELGRMIREAKQRHASDPDPDLADHIDSLIERAGDLAEEILEARASNKGGGLTPMVEASTTCSLSVGYAADARAGWCGPEAVASGSFNDSCNHFGEVYLTSYAQGWHSGLFRTNSDDHPRAGTTGSHSASVSSSVEASTTCHSDAYAEVQVEDDLGNPSTWFRTDTNSVCRKALTAGITGSTSITVPYGSSYRQTWYASAGATPDTYAWYWGGTLVGTGSSYSRTFYSTNPSFEYTQSHSLSLTVTKCGQSASASRTVSVTYQGYDDPCIEAATDAALPPPEPCLY